MIYFISGLSSRQIQIDKILESNDKKNKLYFDEHRVSEFLSELNSGLLFSEPNLLYLKNASKIKDIHKILKNISESEYDNKDILIDFPCEKENKKIKEVTKNFKCYEILDEKENKKNLVKYIIKKLNCSNEDANILLEITGNDFNNIKNEVNKIELFLNGEDYNFEYIKDILSKNTNFIIFTVTHDILSKKKINYEIKEHMALLSALTNSLELLYKIKVLNLPNMSYNKFKDYISNIEIFKNLSPYYVYKNIQYINNFSKERLLELLELAFQTENNIKNGIIPLEIGIETYILEIIK